MSVVQQSLSETTPIGRPDDCQCLSDYTSDDRLPCFACFGDGFDTPNPHADDD